MLTIQKTTNLNGQSTITNEYDAPVQVVNMYATIGENTQPSISKNFQDVTMYLKHKSEVDADLAEFEKIVTDMMAVAEAEREVAADEA